MHYLCLYSLKKPSSTYLFWLKSWELEKFQSLLACFLTIKAIHIVAKIRPSKFSLGFSDSNIIFSLHYLPFLHLTLGSCSLPFPLNLLGISIPIYSMFLPPPPITDLLLANLSFHHFTILHFLLNYCTSLFPSFSVPSFSHPFRGIAPLLRQSSVYRFCRREFQNVNSGALFYKISATESHRKNIDCSVSHVTSYIKHIF